jgi:hypothetical protein
MNTAEAEVLGSSSTATRLENPADIFRKVGLNPALVSTSTSSGQTITSEAFERPGMPTEDTSDKQNLICNNSATQEFRRTSSVTGNKTQTQNCDGASTDVPGKYGSVTESKPRITNIITTTKDVLQNHGFVGEDGKPDAFQTNITAPSPEVFSINPERGISEATTLSPRDASRNNTTGPSLVADTETTPVVFEETYSTPASSTPEFETISLTTIQATTPLPFSTPANLWWGGSKRRHHGQHKAQKVATLLKVASKVKSIISNRRNDRRWRLK